MTFSDSAGYYRSNLSGDAAYRSFVPNPLPPHIEFDCELVKALVEANSSLVLLNALSERIPNMSIFLSMYVRKEALMSSQIEGTQATLEDVLDPTIEKNTNRDVEEVVNYVKATGYAIQRLESMPLCNRLLREAHALLMSGTRGQDKDPGHFRHSQNWIGAWNCAIRNAKYIPPNPEDMEKAMSDLEKYINSEDSMDVLIKAALIHYQFETIHPFLDGNGRIGRLLITLYLMDKKILSSPALYVSYYLKKNRIEYYDRMNEVREKGNFYQWIMFFLKAVSESALDAISSIDELNYLHEKSLSQINTMGRAGESAKTVFFYTEKNPIIDIGKTAKALGLSFNTVSAAVNKLCAAGILDRSGNAARNRIFVYRTYLDILKRGT